MLDIRELMSNAGIQVLFVSFNNYPLRWNPSKGSLKEPAQSKPNFLYTKFIKIFFLLLILQTILSIIL